MLYRESARGNQVVQMATGRPPCEKKKTRKSLTHQAQGAPGTPLNAPGVQDRSGGFADEMSMKHNTNTKVD